MFNWINPLYPIVMLDVFDNVVTAIQNLTASMLKIVIPGGILMVVVCAVMMIFVDEQEHPRWKSRLKKVLFAVGIAMLATLMVNYVSSTMTFTS